MQPARRHPAAAPAGEEPLMGFMNVSPNVPLESTLRLFEDNRAAAASVGSVSTVTCAVLTPDTRNKSSAPAHDVTDDGNITEQDLLPGPYLDSNDSKVLTIAAGTTSEISETDYANTTTTIVSDSYNRLCSDSSVRLTTSSFKWMKPLGRGQFGRVYKGREKVTGERGTVALKVMELQVLTERDMIAQAHLERRVHAAVDNHANICSYVGFFECTQRKALVLVLEHCAGGTLYDMMQSRRRRRFDEPTAAHYISCLASALSHVHARGFLHRDLKPENVLLDSSDGLAVPKLADFGWACDELYSDERCGSLDYMSPQMVQLEEYTTDVDAWALGVLAYELLIGVPPFERDGERGLDVGQMRNNTMSRIVAREYHWPQRPNISKDARNCIDGLLTINPFDRFTLKQVLNHPWIVKHTKN